MVAFSGNAFRIDDTNILAIARQIAHDPLHPYSFSINWLGMPDRAFDILANPPLIPAWLALWAKVFGWSEVSLHLSMVPFSVLALLAFGSLAGRFGYGPGVSMGLLLCSPAFFLGSLVVMPDVAMLALLLGALAGLFAAFDGASPRVAIALSCWCAFFTPLCKYNGVILIPLLLFLLWQRKQWRRLILAPLIAAIAGMTLWSVYSAIVYGEPHILRIARFEKTFEIGTLPLFATFIAALGLAVVPFARHAVASWTLPRAAVCGGAAVLGALYSGFVFASSLSATLLFAAAAGMSAATLLHLLRGLREKKGDSWTSFLVLWIVLVLLMQLRVLFMAPRYLLPLLPPILLSFPALRSNRRLLLALGANLVLVLLLAAADASTANISRRFVEEVSRSRQPGGTLFFAGHWGYQFYAERAGGQQVDSQNPALRLHDLYTFPRSPMALPDPPHPSAVEGVRLERKLVRIPKPFLLQTVDCDAEANFYGPHIGACRDRPLILPFGFSRAGSEEFIVFRGR